MCLKIYSTQRLNKQNIVEDFFKNDPSQYLMAAVNTLVVILGIAIFSFCKINPFASMNIKVL